jgi:hypothetical protein
MDDLNRQLQRWHDADADDREDDADAACSALFAAVTREPVVRAAFAAETLTAIEAAMASDTRRAKRVRRAAIISSVAAAGVGIYTGGSWLLWALSSILVGGIELLIGTIVRVIGAVQGGADLWTLISALGRAAGAFVTDPTVTVVILALQGIAMAALVALQRLLGSDRESLK